MEKAPLLWSVMGNRQKLDGGAMFGNAPKAVWQRWFAADERNRIELACRSLLLQEPGGRRILFEVGVGAFFPPKLRERYGVFESEHMLLKNLHRLGIGDEQIDVIVLSHLHFDHAGGLLETYAEGVAPRLRFSKARYVVSELALQRAQNPHPRDRASFIEGLPALLEQSGRLVVVPEGADSIELLGPDYRFVFSDGHTPGLMLTEIRSTTHPILYAGDLIPGQAWVHLPITMGYDRFPELLIEEKRAILQHLHDRRGYLFFTHDPAVALGEVCWDSATNKYQLGESHGDLHGEAL